MTIDAVLEDAPTGRDGVEPVSGPLFGLRVVGLEQSVAGPLCTRILAELGAEVIKIERAPNGDFARRWDDHVHGESAQFWWLNRGKGSVMLDLRTDEGSRTLEHLLRGADVLVHNMSPAAADRLGLGAGALLERYPQLINCQISGYGASGSFRDRKAYDMLVQAESGIMSLTGAPEGPVRVGVSICDVATGLYAAIAILAAVVDRERSGRGRYLDLAMFDAAVEFVGPMLLSFVNGGVEYPRIPDRHHAIAPYGRFRCSDGNWIMLAVEHDEEWQRFCVEIVGDAALAEDPRFARNVDRIRHRDEVDAIVADVFASRSVMEAAETLDRSSFAYARVNDVPAVAAHEMTAERQILRRSETSDGRDVVAMVGLCERLFSAGAAVRQRPPALDEDRRVLADLFTEAQDG